MKHILVVDDNSLNLRAAETALSDIYRVTTVLSGARALKFLAHGTCDLIILDINMPEIDGFEVLRRIRADEANTNIPVVFLTVDNDPETESRCLEEGAVDFITKPFKPNVMRARIGRILELDELRRDLAKKLEERMEHIRAIQQKTLTGMASMVESRDNSTGGHIRRTGEAVRIFADKLLEAGAYPKPFLEAVVRAAPMHDLGKIAVDDHVLRKQSKFTEEEYNEMKKHSAEGARIVRQILDNVEEEDFVRIAVNVAYYHHERWDGTGYPFGLSGTDIPVEARIMALADVFDALVSRRCYKDAFSYDEAFRIIQESLGTHFDPELGKLFISCRPELEAFYNSYADK